MAYITVSELPELNKDELTGEEYLFVTSSDISNKVKVGTFNDYIDTKISETGLNKIKVYDEGIEVGSVQKINFIGADVNSFINNKESRVDVYIPSYNMVSTFNTSDGSTNAVISKSNYTERYGSTGFIGEWAGLQKCVKGTLNYFTPDKFKIVSGSKIKVEVVRDTSVLKSAIINLDGNKNITANGINIIISNFLDENFYFSGKFECSIDLSDIAGKFKVRIIYSDSEDYVFEDYEMFSDNSNEISVINTNFDFYNNIYRYLSGIKYISTGTSLNISSNLQKANSLSFPLNIMDFDGTLAGISLYNVNFTDFANYNNNYIVDNNYNTNRTLLLNKYYNGNLIIKSRVNDWVPGTWVNSTIRGLVDTYSDTATRVYEGFVSETNRLNSDFTAFNSSLELTDGLQVNNSRLIYPQENFSEFYGNPDYSNKTGNRIYIRKFWHNNISHSNGIFQLTSNLIETDLSSGDIKIEISLDGINWYDCSKDYIGGILVNGSGCRINSDINSLNINNKIEFTLGLNKFTDINSNWGIYIKITFKEIKNKYIDVLQIINWN